jgi:hypothetical protein
VADKKHPNDDYVNPTSPVSAQPIPPEIFPSEIAKQSRTYQRLGSVEGGAVPAQGEREADVESQRIRDEQRKREAKASKS